MYSFILHRRHSNSKFFVEFLNLYIQFSGTTILWQYFTSLEGIWNCFNITQDVAILTELGIRNLADNLSEYT